MRSLAPSRATLPTPSKTSSSPPTRARSGGLHRLQGKTTPLPAATRQRLEQGLGQSLNGVQLDQSPAAAQWVASYPARALTYGNTIYLGAGESSDDIQLMGHEAAHVLQQRGGPTPQAAGGGDVGALEHEASAAGQALASGEPFNVTGRAATAPQAETQPKSRWERFKDTVGEALEFTEDLAWSLLEKFSPELVPIVRKGPEGVLDWMKERATGAFEAVVDKVMAPVRAISGVSAQLSAQFAPWLAWVRDAAVKISQNDCSPLREAADKIEAVATKVIGYVVDKLQPLFTKVKEWGNALWDKIGAPIWGWIKDYAAWHWNMLQKLGNWVWDNTAWIRGKAAQVWTWIKNKLGIGDGPEGQNGILQWVQAKLNAAWDKIKTKLAPYQAQILAVAKVVGVVALAVSPAGPIIAAGAAVYGVVQAVRWIKANWRGNLVVQARAYLQQTLIPALLGAAKKLGNAVNGVAKQISDGVSRFANSVGSLVGLAAGSALSFLVKGAQWLADQINDLALWASAKLLGLANWLEQALNSLQSGFEKFLAFLKRVGNVILDVYSLPLALAEKVWNWVPACIRDPFVDFIIPIIIKQIELFRDLVADPAAWQRTKAEVMRLVRLVFKDRDLKGAVRAAFEFVLRVFNIPIEFLARIKQKALAAWDTVSKKPLAFIKNAVRSMGNGFARFKNNIRKHLLFGIEGWLLGEVADKGISMPESWSDPKAVFGFVMDVLGLSMDHMFELLKKRFSEDKVNKAKKAYGYIKRAWNWVTSLIDTSKSPAENTKALVERAKEFAKTVFTGIVEWIIGRVGTELAVLAAAAAASAGLSEVVDIVRRIYKVMLTAQRWMRKILDMVDQALDKVLDIAAGAFDTVGEAFEAILHKGMPVVMGFLADQFGLSGVGTALRDIIDGLRAKVDEAILWLIDKVKALIEAAINLVKAGVKAVLDWWNKKVDFEDVNGQSHKVLLEGGPDNPEIYVHSNRARLADIVKDASKMLSGPANKKIRADLRTHKEACDQLIKQLDDAGARGKPATGIVDQNKVKDLSDKLEQELNKIATILKQANLNSAGVLGLPRPVYSFSSSGGLATGARVTNLSANRPMGSRPGEDPIGWKYLDDTKQVHTQGEPHYVRMHLINDRLGGPGQRQNLVPGPNDTNGDMERIFESPVKEMVGDTPMQENKPSLIEMTVSVSYRSGSKVGKNGQTIDLSKYPERITGSWKYLNTPPDPHQTPKPLNLEIKEPA